MPEQPKNAAKRRLRAKAAIPSEPATEPDSRRAREASARPQRAQCGDECLPPNPCSCVAIDAEAIYWLGFAAFTWLQKNPKHIAAADVKAALNWLHDVLHTGLNPDAT